MMLVLGGRALVSRNLCPAGFASDGAARCPQAAWSSVPTGLPTSEEVHGISYAPEVRVLAPYLRGSELRAPCFVPVGGL